MDITTTPNFENKKVVKYLGIVSGEAILGVNFTKDVFSAITNIVGGRSSEYEGELVEAKNIALKEMSERAAELNANAVVGVDLDYETLRNGTMLMVSASGTAVVLE